MVEYIESTGTQYIDTGVSENYCYMFEFEFKPNSINTSWQSYLGGTLDNFTIGAYNNNTNGSYLRYRTSEMFKENNINANGKNSIKVIDNTCSVNNKTYSAVNTSNSVGTGGKNIMICNNASLSRYSNACIYSLSLYDEKKYY